MQYSQVYSLGQDSLYKFCKPVLVHGSHIVSSRQEDGEGHSHPAEAAHLSKNQVYWLLKYIWDLWGIMLENGNVVFFFIYRRIVNLFLLSVKNYSVLEGSCIYHCSNVPSCILWKPVGDYVQIKVEIYNSITIFNICVGYLSTNLNKNALMHVTLAFSHTSVGISGPC